MRKLIAPLVAVLALAPLTGLAPAQAREPAAPYEVDHFTANAHDDPRLVRAWHAWEGRDHGRYTTVVQPSCFCPAQQAVRTEVRGGTVESVTYDGRERQLGQHGYEMDALFRLLRRAYAEADEVVVDYRRGVPSSIAIDWSRQIADEESYYRVTVVDTDRAAPYAYAITPFRVRPDDRPALKAGWRAWREAGLRDYTTTVRRVAGEPVYPIVRTDVSRGVVLGYRTVDAPGHEGAAPPRRGYEIERLYREIRRLYASADEVHVTYSERGVPRVISADPIEGAVDDEYFVQTSLRRLSPAG